ncbi:MULTISPECIES: hypothetical protein [Pseudomonas]|jgi:hypothetical protein|uniref:DUF1902 domain-containing protein n=1 Tax=Pseudomonas monachiensis TaxID=3060212 RepID=A0ABW9HGR4_9PSED|nr:MULTISPECIES: hypothetical protein [unclassified Pseudomonas]KRB03700.1 hypothetical protein ASD91_24460 [Pseudomonas sp. Root68]KRB71075.1 hypothetical protein ASD95_22695 [Pseudomonas sp. Root71]
MNIDITEQRVPHCWVVHLDALEVNFNSQEAASSFVGQLKARIEAPHVWPVTVRSAASCRTVPAREQEVRFDLVE